MSRKTIPDRDAAFADPNLRPTPSWLEYFKDADKRTPGVAFSTTAPTNGQVFVYNATTGLLEPSNNAPKAWCNFTGSNGALNESVGVSGIVRNSAGNYTLTFTTAFASATSYIGTGSTEHNAASSVVQFGSGGSKTTTTILILVTNVATHALVDPDFVNVAFYGRQ